MDLFHVLEYLHILGAMVLFGTGLGIAFFMYMADRSGDVALIAGTARIVVIADLVFTATAVIVQPVTGLAMVMLSGHTLDESWIVLSLALFVMVGLLWLPVVWMQNEMRKMAVAARDGGTVLPARYRRYMRLWFWMGWPAFFGVLAILYLMIEKPQVW